jgi:hypothetical protein
MQNNCFGIFQNFQDLFEFSGVYLICGILIFFRIFLEFVVFMGLKAAYISHQITQKGNLMVSFDYVINPFPHFHF